MVPCVIFEDEHLLAVNKPAGLNTHAPSPHAGEGLYDWLRHREPRWATLAIIHRLDKETSGVLVFAKTPLANRALSAQFAGRRARKRYLLLTDHQPPRREWRVKNAIARVGDRYASVARGAPAETRFRVLGGAAAMEVAPTDAEPVEFTPASQAERGRPRPQQLPQTPKATLASVIRAGEGTRAPFGPAAHVLVSAEPLTGRTHQVRVHAAESGCPALGDALYGGTPAARVFLHAAELTLQHPATGEELRLTAPADFSADPRLALRRALVDPAETNAFRLLHGAADGWPGWFVDQLGERLLSQGAGQLTEAQQAWLLARVPERGHPRPSLPVPSGGTTLAAATCAMSAGPHTAEMSEGAVAAFHKRLERDPRRVARDEASPRLVAGAAPGEPFTVRENGVRFELNFEAGGSVGLFLDQRDNRRRFLTGHVAAGFPMLPSAGSPGAPLAGATLLNTFAYTCGFSVCAALAGAHTTSLDLSRNYLDWGRRNFAHNGLEAARHDFIFGDAFDWFRRLAKRGRSFDLVALDPPTFSQSKSGGAFRAAKDYDRLVTAALSALKRGGVLFASCNAAGWPAEEFLAAVRKAVAGARRRVRREQFFPQPPDFPITRNEPGHLKTVWLRVE